MKSAGDLPGSMPLGEADCYFLTIDKMMNRAGHGMLLGQTIVELQGRPDQQVLADAVGKLSDLYPYITWSPTSPRVPFRAPVFAPSENPVSTVPFQVWKDEDGDSVCEKWLNACPAEFNKDGYTNARFDLILNGDQSSRFVITWRHTAFDAGGADLLLREIASLADQGKSYIETPVEPQDRTAREGGTIRDHIKASAPMRKYVDDLMNNYQMKSFAGIESIGGKNLITRTTLDEDESSQIFRNAEEHSGLFSSLYYLASATRAHHRLWELRGSVPDAYFLTMPVSLRKAGAKSPLFQNNLTNSFYFIESKYANDIREMCEQFSKQQMRFRKEKLDVSFRHLQHILRYLPPKLVTTFLRHKLRGFAAFMHSHTGELANGLTSLAGANIENAWHTPAIFSPPGTGIFLSQKLGRITALTSWREGLITDQEQEFLTDEFLTSLRNA